MSTPRTWFVADAGRSSPALSEIEFIERVRLGSISNDTQIWREGLPEWVRFEEDVEAARIADVLLSEEVWLIVLNKKVSRDPAGPYSQREIATLLRNESARLDSLVWRKGLPGWERIGGCTEMQRATRLASEKILHAPSASPADSVFPPAVVGAARAGFNSTGDPVALGAFTTSESVPLGACLGLRRVLMGVFKDSESSAPVDLMIVHVERGVSVGDPVMIDRALDAIRRFLLAEACSPRAGTEHPCMTEKGLRACAQALHALTDDADVIERVASFDQLFARERGFAPSITAARTRQMLSLAAPEQVTLLVQRAG